MLKEQHADEFILQFLENQKKSKEHFLERNFCYELYYEWKLMFKESDNYRDLKLNGEVSKMNLTIPLNKYKELRHSELIGIIKAYGLITQTYFVPDLVLHGGQDSITAQELIVEVKYFDNMKKGDFEKDFYKLALYQTIFQFKSCVFVIVDDAYEPTRDSIRKKLVSSLKVNKDLVDQERFWFVVKTVERTFKYRLSEI